MLNIKILITDLKEKKLLVYFLFFVFVFSVHLVGLNKIGRTWDEQYKVDAGFVGLDRLLAHDFSFESWNWGKELPMVGKYIYGFFMRPEVVYLKGPTGAAQLFPADIEMLENGNYILTVFYDKLYAVPYDFTFPRIVSALFNSFAVLLTVIFARFLLGYPWSFLPGVFLLFTPRFVFLGQLVTFESLSVFLFCLIIFLFNKFLNKPASLILSISIGILCGLFFWTRYNNIIFFPFLAGWLCIHYFFKKQKNIFTWRLIVIPTIAFVLGIAIWPVVWHEFPKYLIESLGFHGNRLVGASSYYWENLAITTPIPILVGFFIGVLMCLKKRGYWHVLFVWWVLCAVILYTIFCIRSGGTRYVAILYPAIGVISSYGYLSILKRKFVLLLFAIVLFLVIEQVRVFPYYLDYFNQLIGGASGAIKKGYDFAWWGEGQREIGLWINKNAVQGESVGLIVTPKYVFPKTRKDIIFKAYVDEKSDADYIVVSRGDYSRLPKIFFKKHKVVYEADVDREALVYVMKRI